MFSQNGSLRTFGLTICQLFLKNYYFMSALALKGTVSKQTPPPLWFSVGRRLVSLLPGSTGYKGLRRINSSSLVAQ